MSKILSTEVSEKTTSTDTSGNINGGPALSRDDACNTIWSGPESIGDDGFDGDPSSLDEKADKSSEDCIEPDFIVEDECSVNSLGRRDQQSSSSLSHYDPRLLWACIYHQEPRVTFPLRCPNESFSSFGELILSSLIKDQRREI